MYISIVKIISTEMTNIFVCKPMIMKNSIPYIQKLKPYTLWRVENVGNWYEYSWISHLNSSK